MSEEAREAAQRVANAAGEILNGKEFSSEKEAVAAALEAVNKTKKTVSDEVWNRIREIIMPDIQRMIEYFENS